MHSTILQVPAHCARHGHDLQVRRRQRPAQPVLGPAPRRRRRHDDARRQADRAHQPGRRLAHVRDPRPRRQRPARGRRRRREEPVLGRRRARSRRRTDTITFTFRTGKPGRYRWQCFVPCAAGFLYGFGGPMQTVGYMDGFLNVTYRCSETTDPTISARPPAAAWPCSGRSSAIAALLVSSCWARTCRPGAHPPRRPSRRRRTSSSPPILTPIAIGLLGLLRLRAPDVPPARRRDRGRPADRRQQPRPERLGRLHHADRAVPGRPTAPTPCTLLESSAARRGRRPGLRLRSSTPAGKALQVQVIGQQWQFTYPLSRSTAASRRTQLALPVGPHGRVPRDLAGRHPLVLGLPARRQGRRRSRRRQHRVSSTPQQAGQLRRPLRRAVRPLARLHARHGRSVVGRRSHAGCAAAQVANAPATSACRPTARLLPRPDRAGRLDGTPRLPRRPR